MSRRRSPFRKPLISAGVMREVGRVAAKALDGTGQLPLPGMAVACIAAEKQRKGRDVDMSQETNLDLRCRGIGLGTQLALVFEAGTVLRPGDRYNISAALLPDGHVVVRLFKEQRGRASVFVVEEKEGGVREVRLGLRNEFPDIPTFGQTALSSFHRVGDNWELVLPAQRNTLRSQIKKRGGSFPKQPEASTVTRDEFRAAIKAVNAFKAHMGSSLKLHINTESGELRASILEEFG